MSCSPKCPGWDFFDDNQGPGIKIQRCDECNRFASDEDALAHLQGIVSMAYLRDDQRLVTLATENSDAWDWEQLGQPPEAKPS